MVLNVGGNTDIKAANISNAGLGQSVIRSEGNVNIGSINTERTNNVVRDPTLFHKDSIVQDVGTQIQTVGNLTVDGKNITVQGSQLSSEKGTTVLKAKENVGITEGRRIIEQQNQAEFEKKGSFSSSKTSSYSHNNADMALASVVEGNKVIIDANNVNIRGSNIVSDDLTQITAKENVSISAAENRVFSESKDVVSKSGLMSTGGIGFSLGKEKDTTVQSNTQVTNTGSSVGSLKGDTTIIAGNHYQQTGSTVSSTEADVNIQAKSVNIEAAKDQQNENYRNEYEKKGLTLAVNVPVVSAVQGAIASIQHVGQSKNDRVNAMAAANAGFDAYKAGQSLAKLKDAASDAGKLADAGVSATLTYGEQKNINERESHSNTASQSQVYAGGKTTIVATGGGDKSDINIIGSDVLGMQGTTLAADHDVNIKAAEQNSSDASKNSSQGWNAGVAASYGSGGGAIGVTAGGNVGKGKGEGQESSYLNSSVGSAESQTSIISGNTTNIIGGQVQGKGVTVDAKELNIESLQDTATYKSKQQNIEGQATVGFGGASVSGSASKSNIDANYASVNEQSGIFAGDDGYQVNVKNNTDLKGAIITSTGTAESLGKNNLSTGTLTTSDIHNSSEYDAKGIGISASVNVNGGWDKSGKDKEGRGSNTVNKSVGFGLDSDKASSTTSSGINTKNINIADEAAQQALTDKTAEQTKADIFTTVTTDTARENSGSIANNFDKEKVQSEINTQVEVTKRFDQNRQEAKKEIYNYVDSKRAEAAAIREKTLIDGKNGYNTAESLKLEDDATKWEKRAFYLDAVAGALYGYGSSTALTYVGSAVSADPVRRAATAPQQIWEISCGTDSLYCADSNLDGSKRPLENGKAQIGDKRQLFDINEIAPSISSGVITLSNNGIMNPLDDALKNAVKQNLWSINKEGVLVVYNPPTTNFVSELLYAGYDKTNDLLGGRLPLTNAEKTNIELYKYAQDKGYLLDLSNHSRGGLTASVAIQNANRNGLTEVPLNKVRFYGTATNVQDYSDWLIKNNKFINPETNNSTGVYSAVHQAGRIQT